MSTTTKTEELDGLQADEAPELTTMPDAASLEEGWSELDLAASSDEKRIKIDEISGLWRVDTKDYALEEFLPEAIDARPTSTQKSAGVRVAQLAPRSQRAPEDAPRIAAFEPGPKRTREVPPELEAKPEALRAPRHNAWSVAALALLPVALVLTLGFVARTRMVLGPPLSEVLAEQAKARDIELFIGGIRPSGLFGLQLHRVRARAHHGPYALDTQLDTVTLAPDVLATLRQGRLVLDTVALRGAHVVLERDPSRADTPPSAQDEDTRRERAATASSSSVGAPAYLANDAMHLIAKDVTLELRAGRSFASTRPLTMERVALTLPLTGAPLPKELEARGVLPDGTPFELATRELEGERGTRYVLEPEARTRIDLWFKDQLPFQMTTGKMSACAECGKDAIQFSDTSMKLPTLGRGLEIAAHESTVDWVQGRADLRLHDVEITGADHAVRLGRTHFMFDTQTGAHTGELMMFEGQAGSLEVSWTYDAPEKLWSAAMTAQRFSMRPLLAMAGVDAHVHAGDLTGTLNGTADLSAQVMELQSALTIERGAATFPRIAAERLEVDRMQWTSSVLVDMQARALSVVDGALQIGDIHPIALSGRIEDAQRGYTFHAHIKGDGLDAEALRSSLPSVIAEPVEGAEFSGTFDVDITAGGHTEYPDSLQLELLFGGDVQVVRDSHVADIRSLATAGAPGLTRDSELVQPTPLEEWTSYASLPLHIPHTLLAAEDATFFEHNGFDVGGLRRAMVHNLKVKRWERGGSTITQQLTKNLYLSRQKTIVRKAQEAYLTWRIESELTKERILELYMNIAHWGEDLHGIRGAAQRYFERPPQELSIAQTALLAALLPNPVRFGGQIHRGHIASSRITKFEHVLSNLAYLDQITQEDYRFLMAKAKRGEIGGLELTICADDDTAPEGAAPCSSVQEDRL
ncbi:MAG: biosynthetic peptidoglycan transglycosylase [Myxococcota bacterium]